MLVMHVSGHLKHNGRSSSNSLPLTILVLCVSVFTVPTCIRSVHFMLHLTNNITFAMMANTVMHFLQIYFLVIELGNICVLCYWLRDLIVL